MAKKLAEFQAAFKKDETALKEAEAGLERYLNNRQKQKASLLEGSKMLKERITELKAKGVKHPTTEEYAKADKETMTLLIGMKKTFADVIGTVNAFNADLKKFKGARDDLKTIGDALDAEVALRDKKKEGAIAVDSKSLPDLKKLQAEVKKKLNEVRDTLGTYSTIDEKKEQTELDNFIKGAAA